MQKKFDPFENQLKIGFNMAEKPDHHVKYTFNTEWFDTQASLTRHYQLYYFPVDKTIEMVRCSSVADALGTIQT